MQLLMKTGAGRLLAQSGCAMSDFTTYISYIFLVFLVFMISAYYNIKMCAVDKRKEIIMQLQRLLSFARKAVDEYTMIQEGDHIAVGISGGKTVLHCSALSTV